MYSNEVCNAEGLKSWHTGDGVLLPKVTGAEYLGIFGVWDWETLPGMCRALVPSARCSSFVLVLTLQLELLRDSIEMIRLNLR
jgi:hypothetical protein